jgi:hypothetical protein
MRRLLIIPAAAVAVALTACGSNADVVSDNISKEAEKFQVQRKIIGINGITDKVLFEVEGKCSLEYGESMDRTLDVICKHGPDDYRKHYVGMSDNVSFISTQVDGIDVSEYRTKIILKPENLVPDIDLVTGEQYDSGVNP